MNLSGSKTKRNLKAAFAAECEARNRYIFCGDQADAEGIHHVADVFYELAANEGEHAKGEFEFRIQPRAYSSASSISGMTSSGFLKGAMR